MSYTTIKVKCLDQTLQLVNSPKIASGGVEEVRMEFEFCPLWEGLAKTAVFYRDPKEAYQVLLGSDDACVVPFEVLAKPGRLSFGVIGMGDTEVRTAEVMGLQIVHGASLEGTTPPGEPNPEIYQQILAEMQRTREAAEDLIIVGPTPPTHHALWFCTADPAAPVDTLTLDENTEGAQVMAEVDGATYAATNATLNGQATVSNYNFDII